MDICGEALIGFVCAHGDAFEFLELAEEVFDQVAPLVDFRVDRLRRSAPWMLRDDDLGAAHPLNRKTPQLAGISGKSGGKVSRRWTAWQSPREFPGIREFYREFCDSGA
jgi:hypothetical protein